MARLNSKAMVAAVVLAAVVLMMAGREASAALSCGQVDSKLAPCVAYVTGRASSISKECCSGVPQEPRHQHQVHQHGQGLRRARQVRRQCALPHQHVHQLRHCQLVQYITLPTCMHGRACVELNVYVDGVLIRY
uniref:Bifunctional inhibitor/plant lipid transfer protein/seed storage helical domain-containing protein n=1 Tax=Triticum urartu TaxID=4572 RepID=A0A8R7VDT4_TRIUA